NAPRIAARLARTQPSRPTTAPSVGARSGPSSVHRRAAASTAAMSPATSRRRSATRAGSGRAEGTTSRAAHRATPSSTMRRSADASGMRGLLAGPDDPIRPRDRADRRTDDAPDGDGRSDLLARPRTLDEQPVEDAEPQH